ncbi:MAG: ion transporter [Planctomycetota bacterium]
MGEKTKREQVAWIYDFVLLFLCAYVLLALAVDTFFRLPREVRTILEYSDTLICALFMADFLGRLWLAPNKWRYLRWGWIDFFSSIPATGILRAGRLFRVVRILRLFRGVRSTKVLIAYILKHRAQGVFASTALVSFVLIVFSSIAILQAEKGPGGNIHTPEDALWFSFATITTVGYGDIYPITRLGRFVAVLLMTAGMGMFGVFTGLIASWFLGQEAEAETRQIHRLAEQIHALSREIDRLSRAPGPPPED